MTQSLIAIKKDFTEGLSQISRFWGFPKGMGAIFGVLYLSPAPLSLDEIVQEKSNDVTVTPRRDFLKFLGFSVAAASLAACEAPVR